MSTRRRLLALFGATALGVWLPSAQAAPGDDEIVIILNKRNPTKALNRTTVESIFSGKTAFWNGVVPIRTYMFRETHETTAAFLEKVIKTDPRRFFQNWTKRKLADAGVAPATLATAHEIIEAVAKYPGAIGFAKKREIAEAGNFDKVRFVKVSP